MVNTQNDTRTIPKRIIPIFGAAGAIIIADQILHLREFPLPFAIIGAILFGMVGYMFAWDLVIRNKL